MIKYPDKSEWPGYCGKYQHPENEDFAIGEVLMKEEELWANVVIIDDDYNRPADLTFRLYPTGENEFGRKGGMIRLTFGDGCLMFDDITCKKL